MSGTSADGIDAVVVRFRGNSFTAKPELRAHVQMPFSSGLRRRVLEASAQGSVAEICELNFVLGEKFAAAALLAVKAAKLQPADISAIGSHGQTVHHLPRAEHPSTLQIGEPCVIAERTGVMTIADFRVRDMAAGGQGAPLVSYADWILFSNRRHPRIIQNIGGIGNLTFLPTNGGLDDVFAFDTGPGNMVIDAVVSILSRGRKTFDRDGAWASRGRISDRLLTWGLAHRYFVRKIPKTTGREEFGAAFVHQFMAQAKRMRLSDADQVATATALTAESIAAAYRRFVVPRLARAEIGNLQIILGGGGAKNPTLRAMLRERFDFGTFCTHDDFGIDNSAKEALAFAILARATRFGFPGNVPSVTGACRPVILGKMIPA